MTRTTRPEGALDAVDRIVERWRLRDPGLDVSPLQVAGRLLLCAEHLRHALVAALRPLGLSFGDFDVVNTLRRLDDEGGTSPGRLARSSLVTSGAMTARLDRLERAGLVTRSVDGRDGRSRRVRLTAEGEARAEPALRAVLAADEAFLAPLAAGDREAVAAILRTVLLAREAAEGRSGVVEHGRPRSGARNPAPGSGRSRSARRG